jgi:inner membrane protein
VDNLTHTLTGLMLSRAGLDRWCPRAPALLVLAANVPDIDVVTALTGGSISYLEHHRGPTHSLALAPVMAALVVAMVGAAARGRNMAWVRAWVASTAGVMSHLLMDWTNIYGVRLLWPLDRSWLRLDITPVVDLWIWTLLAVMAIWPALARLVSAEIGARSQAGRGIAWFALLALGSYEFGRGLLHQRAVDTLESRIYEGRAPLRTAAMPSFVNPLRWTGLVEVDHGYLVLAVDLAREFDPDSGRRYYQAAPGPELEAARRTRAFQVFSSFSQFLLWQATPLPEPEGSVRIDGVDMRFGVPGDGRFTASAVLESGRVVRSWFQFTPPGRLPRPK